ncbi:MAG: hypothetical protein J6X91_03620 [Bacteroidales bacterium]|nr:hypothetical protein [Bacteroidales bacterium]
MVRLSKVEVKELIKGSVERVLSMLESSSSLFLKKDEVFDLDKIPQDVLDRNYVLYSPYRLSASCDSRLQLSVSGRYLCDDIDYEESVDEAIEGITHTFPIDEVYQVSKQKGYHDIYVALLVANKQGNIDIIIESMGQYNYFLSKNTPSVVLKKGDQEWIDLRFEPRLQDDVSDKVRKMYATLGHLSPAINKDNILENGLLASNNNPVFKYPSPRLYLIEENATNNDIKMLTQTLFGQALEKGIKGLTPEYILFSIDLSKVPDTTHFYWDVNEKFGLFTDSNIPPEAISIVRTVWAEDKK